MKRTQIYLTKSQKEALEARARRKGTTVSELIRNMINQGLESNQKKTLVRKKEPSMFDVLEEIKKMGFSGPPDLAENLDDYLYGGKK